MRKKLLCILLSLVLCFSILSGCIFFEKNEERDSQQVVAVIAPITETKDVNGETKTFTSEKKLIYKSQMWNKFQSVAGDLIQNQGYTYNEALDYSLQILVVQKLIEIEADKRLAFGDMVWRDFAAEGEKEADYTDYNAVQKLIYNTIDSQLHSIRNTLLTEQGKPTFEPGEGPESSTATFPIKPAESNEDEEIKEPTRWKPDKTRYPGYGEEQEMASRELTALDRLITLLDSSCKEDFRASSEDRKKFKEDMDKIKTVKDTAGASEVYGILGGLHMVDWVFGKSAVEQIKISKLQKRVTDDATISRDQVVEKYEGLKKGQEASYETVSNYHAAIKDGKTTIVVHPTSDYFYVNHILIPFSDSQKAELDAAKKDPLATKDSIESFRKNLVDQIVAYPHVDGENDVDNPMTVNEIMAEIRSVMAPFSADISKDAKVERPILRDAEKAFEDLVYKYNTDSSSTGKHEGYVVKKKLDDGEEETYMKEFAELSRELENTQREGTFLDKKVITDYGVHILYLNKTIQMPLTYDIDDYVTYGEYDTYYDMIYDTMLTSKQDKVFEEFQQDVMINNEKKLTKYTDRYKDLYA